MANRNKRITRTNNRLSEVPTANISRSTFDRSHGLKTTFDAGLLIPIYVDEAMPGDTFTMSMNGFARLATPLHPTMDNLYLETFFFSIPNRLLWDNWKAFMGEELDPAQIGQTDYRLPKMAAFSPGPEGLSDYFGIPVQDIEAGAVSALPFRAYALCYREFFRDQNLIAADNIPTGDGPDAGSLYPLKRRGKRHDYFTSALPWPQKGDDVTIPLGSQARIHVDLAENNAPTIFSTVDDGWTQLESPGAAGAIVVGGGAGIEENSLYADLSQATATTINALREAFQIQKLLERDARSGTRYNEIIKGHFNVTHPDAQWRPEYLGGGSTRVNVAPVAQTSSTTDSSGPVDTPQGNLAGVGTAAWSGHGWRKSFTEHCTLLGLACVRADLTYQQGINRMWARDTRYDFYWPTLAHLGNQAIKNSEIYYDDDGLNDGTFGYQERYAEYRYKPSMVTGLFRSSADGSLDSWHYAEDFGSRPVLNEIFINDNPPIGRTVAVPTEPEFIADVWFNLKCARPMPVYGIPGYIDHF